MNIFKLSLTIGCLILSSNLYASEIKKTDNSHIENALKTKCLNFDKVEYSDEDKLTCLEILKEGYLNNIPLAKDILDKSLKSEVNIK